MPSSSRPGGLVAALAALLLIGSGALCAQSRFETPTAITGLTVVPEPGRKIDGATVLISNGRIVAVGAQVEIPSHARRIDGTGLWCYAGFIDATAHLGIRDSAPDEHEMARLLGEEQEPARRCLFRWLAIGAPMVPEPSCSVPQGLSMKVPMVFASCPLDKSVFAVSRPRCEHPGSNRKPSPAMEMRSYE